MSLSSIFSLANVFYFVVIALLAMYYQELIDIQQRIRDLTELQQSIATQNAQAITNKNRKIAWIDGDGENPHGTYMQHIVDVFRWSGYEIITGPQADDAEWDVLWTHPYPLSRPQYMSHIQRAGPEKIVNHIQGSGYYTSKVALATSNMTIGVPKAFQLPSEKELFLEYAKEHPDLLWVQKSNAHRNIKIQPMDKLDLEKEDTFVQVFVDNPLLIDNRKFDIGIYTVITSIRPLRVYIYDGEALLRFCPQDYNPFDAENVDKYVVGDDYTPIWEIPSLHHFYNEQKLGWREAFDSYMMAKGVDPRPMWNQIAMIIAEVFQSQQHKMLNAVDGDPLNARLFELSRFDFVVDENLKVYLMEANMSPNLSSGHFKPNQNLYEQVLMNIFSLVGITGQLTKEANRYLSQRENPGHPAVSDRDIRISAPYCYSGECSTCDAKLECQLCGQCMSSETSRFLKMAFLENVNRRRMRRINFNYENRAPLTTEDYLLTMWLTFKCSEDQLWC